MISVKIHQSREVMISPCQEKSSGTCIMPTQFRNSNTRSPQIENRKNQRVREIGVCIWTQLRLNLPVYAGRRKSILFFSFFILFYILHEFYLLFLYFFHILDYFQVSLILWPWYAFFLPIDEIRMKLRMILMFRQTE